MSKSSGKHAVILAGGKGVRLRPYTTNIPKPLVPIGDQYAVLEIVLRQLAFQGFKRATIAAGVPAGTSTPFHASASYLGKPASATVGKSGVNA